jgi:acetylornithine deacetylase/succinyl-diaminopimelate desuccinylase-like protein
LHDDVGNIRVPGLGATGHAEIEMPEAEFRAAAGLVPTYVLAGEGTLADRLWWKGAIAVIGIECPPTRGASNTIIPEAAARLSVRVPPGVDPRAVQDAVRDYLVANAPFGAEVIVEMGVTGEGFITDVEAPVYNLARWALTEGFGRETVAQGQGGSIPLAADIKEVFPDAEVLITGVEDPDARAHSGNESCDLGLVRKAIVAEALLLAALGGQAERTA